MVWYLLDKTYVKIKNHECSWSNQISFILPHHPKSFSNKWEKFSHFKWNFWNDEHENNIYNDFLANKGELFTICDILNCETFGIIMWCFGDCKHHVQGNKLLYSTPLPLIILHILANLESVLLPNYLRKADNNNAIICKCNRSFSVFLFLL